MPSFPLITAGRTRVRSRAVRAALTALVVLFLAGHLPQLVTAPGDVDEVNFVMGVRRFDVGAHQPHPPGYAVFIALGKLAKPASAWLGAAPPDRAGPAPVESRALAFWSAVFGALGLLPLFVLFRSLDDREDVALAATALTAAAPLYWFTSARPLSDVPGLAAILLVDALLVAAWQRQHPAAPAAHEPDQARSPGRLMLAAAFAAGLTVGIRSQSLWLVAPLFGFVVATWRGARAGLLLRSGIAWALGIAVWMVPMLVATGGPAAYIAAVRGQFTEDVALVEMLWTQPTLANLTQWVVVKYLHPWGVVPLALAVMALAATGAAGLIRKPTTLLPLAAAFAPYLVFDALFQEVVTVRYALPGVPLAAFLAVRGLETLAGRWWRWASGVLVAAGLVIGAVALADQERDLPPVSRVLADMRDRQTGGDTAAPVLAMHQPYRPMLRDESLSARVLPLTPMYEWLDLTQYWLDGARTTISFLADPRRAGLAEIDPHGRRLIGTYGFPHRWPFTSALMGGSRPARVQWWELSQPGWMLGEGWALTPEASGVARAGHRGLHEGPLVAHVRRRRDAAVLMIGGRHLAPGDPRPVTLTASIGGRAVASWIVRADPGWFVEWIELESGALTGAGDYATLTVATGPDSPRVGLEQFDLQPQGTEIFAFGAGWHELEYDDRKGVRWRWTSDRATSIIRQAGRDLTLRLVGESPLKYFDAPPTVTVRAGGQVLVRFALESDFTQEITLPASLLEAASGQLVIETDRTFVPAERGGSPDRRRLGLRLFEFSLR